MSSAALRGAPRWLRVSAPAGAFPVGALLAVVGALGAVLALWLGFDRLPLTLCYFKALSGWPCLSCGATRAVVRLAALALVPWAAADLALMTRGRALRASLAPRVRRPLLWLLAAAVLANWAFLIAAGR